MATPTTLTQVHKEVLILILLTLAIVKPPLTRGGGPVVPQQADGWSVAGGSTPRPPSKAGDLSKFGKINRVWVGKKDTTKRDSTLIRVNSRSNMFMMIGRDSGAMSDNWLEPGRVSVGLGVGGTPNLHCNTLQLLPRSRPIEEENEVNGDSADHSGDEGSGGVPPAMSEAEANKKIAEDVDEFFSVRNIRESERYFTKLPSEHHHRLVAKMVSKAVESKEADGKLVADAFARAAEKNLCSISAFEKGFLPVDELLDDIAIDSPKAFQIMATMIKGAGLGDDE